MFEKINGKLTFNFKLIVVTFVSNIRVENISRWGKGSFKISL